MAIHEDAGTLYGVVEQVQNIKAIEHSGDEITHQIFRKLKPNLDHAVRS